MPTRKKSRAKKTARNPKPSRPKKSAPKKAPARATGTARNRSRTIAKRRSPIAREFNLRRRSGPGPGSAGQSGDIEGLSGKPRMDSESVEELAEEGQSFEAEVIDAVEGAPDPDEDEIHTREVPEDDASEDGEP